MCDESGMMAAQAKPPALRSSELCDEAELTARARALGGRTIVEIARELDVPLPRDPRRAKGFVGQLVERALGATSGSRPIPDFGALGVELKTLPVDARGRVRESTFVCTADVVRADASEWASSRVRAKLARVLWVIVEADPRVPHGRRRVGASFLWSPRAEEEALLRADWEELTGALGAGDVERIDARRGRVLQLRPKAADASARTRAFDAEGAPVLAPPRAFYLRARFTRALLARQGLLAPP
ncbi:MAG TPA: DNA mismatch repair endonuclease MutH [Sandaracinaceae bacterium]